MTKSRQEIAQEARGHADGALHHGATVSKAGRDRCIAFVSTILLPVCLPYAAAHVMDRQATEVQCEVAIISDAELLITRSQQDKYRLIVTSRNRCTVLTQVCTWCIFSSSLISQTKTRSTQRLLHLPPISRPELRLPYLACPARRWRETQGVPLSQWVPVPELPQLQR
jgi:hypothetical protein